MLIFTAENQPILLSFQLSIISQKRADFKELRVIIRDAREVFFGKDY